VAYLPSFTRLFAKLLKAIPWVEFIRFARASYKKVYILPYENDIVDRTYEE
jgi:hypothetical protein